MLHIIIFSPYCKVCLRRLLLSYYMKSWLCYCVGVCIHWGYWCWSHCWVRPCRGFSDWGSRFPSTKITAAGTVRQICSPCKVRTSYFMLGLKNIENTWICLYLGLLRRRELFQRRKKFQRALLTRPKAPHSRHKSGNHSVWLMKSFTLLLRAPWKLPQGLETLYI